MPSPLLTLTLLLHRLYRLLTTVPLRSLHCSTHTVPLPRPQAIVDRAHGAKVKVCVATDLLALTMLTPPGEWGADIVIGSAQVS